MAIKLRTTIVHAALITAVFGSGCNKPASAPQPPLARELDPAATPVTPPQANTSQQVQAPVSPPPVKTPPSPQVPAAPATPPLATLAGAPITFEDLRAPLVEGYGLSVLLAIAQLRTVEQAAQQQGIVLSTQDIETEKTLTLRRLFPEASEADHPKALEQLLTQQRSTPGEFNLLMRTNALLRKMVAKAAADQVTDAALQEAFGVLYGQRVVVRHIQLANLMEVGEARRRLAEGQPFERVAADLSRNPRSGPLGGELPPFSRTTTNIPKPFIETAFALEPGQISEVVQADGAYHLIQLQRKLEPSTTNFEDVKETLRVELTERSTQAAVRDLRRQLNRQTLANLDIQDPNLKAQFEKRKQNADD
jgi:peptidyl-prolyl cis-trans isomerase C